MFEKFGEFGTHEEINELAANMLTEGDKESVFELAKENGIDKEIAEAFIEGDLPELCDATTAAIGKIEAEEAELKPKEIMKDWTEYLKVECFEDILLARQVRKKGKSLKGMIANILKWSFANQIPIEDGIKKAAGVNAGKVTLGIPGMGKAKELIRAYYGGKE